VSEARPKPDPVVAPSVESGGEQVELDPGVFGVPVNPALHYDAVRQYMASRRAGTHSTRNRARVAGGGRKPWRQKGTGNARVGSRRNPLWRGGGTVFGPTPRDYAYRLPGRMQRGAGRSALSLRATAGAVRVTRELSFERPSARDLRKRIESWGLGAQRVLIVDESPSRELELSARNLERVEVASVRRLHCYDILRAEAVVIHVSALEALSRKYRESNRDSEARDAA